jgi:hypothetical protein
MTKTAALEFVQGREFELGDLGFEKYLHLKLIPMLE